MEISGDAVYEGLTTDSILKLGDARTGEIEGNMSANLVGENYFETMIMSMIGNVEYDT